MPGWLLCLPQTQAVPPNLALSVLLANFIQNPQTHQKNPTEERTMIITERKQILASQSSLETSLLGLWSTAS